MVMSSIREVYAERTEKWRTIEEQTWSTVDCIAPGIHIYHDVLTAELDVSGVLERYMNENSNDHHWKQAMVGYAETFLEYRDCFDFKFKTDASNKLRKSAAFDKLCAMYDASKHRQLQAVKHYCSIYNVGEMRYWEATNFVKYGIGQHFAEHADHGYSYNCTVSLVGWPNDEYEGGELEFRLWNILHKPKAGDLAIFPSNFMYPHRSLPVKSGIKYSLVTMLDYSEKFHAPGFHEETGN